MRSTHRSDPRPVSRATAADKGEAGLLFVYLAVGISALGGLLFGYDTGVISGAILFVVRDFSLSVPWEEVAVSAALLGAFAGTAAGGIPADRWGRRKVLIICAALYAVSSVGTALAPSFPWLIAGRVFMGAAVGVTSFIAPLYISEISPVALRGRMVSINQIALTGGIVIAYIGDYAFSGSRGWRWMLGLAAVPAVIFGVGMGNLPESPRWLVRHGMVDAARRVLGRLRRAVDVDGEIKDIKESLRKQGSGWPVVLGPHLRPALMIGVGLAVFQQVTGINTVIYYAPTIFKSAGFPSASGAILATIGVGVVNVLMTVAAMQLIDRVGRRPLLLVGLTGMVLSLGVLGGSFALTVHEDTLAWLAVASLIVYVGSFAMGLGPVFWLLISEIYPLKVRGLAMSVATASNWGANLLVSLTFLSLIQLVGRPGAFWLYAAMGIGAWLFVFEYVPETKGRSLEEIEAHWRSRMYPRKEGA